jgi:hypothetical protein
MVLIIFFPQQLQALELSTHQTGEKKRITNEIKVVAMTDDVFEKLDLFLIQQVSPPLLPSPMSHVVVLFPRNTFHGGPNYQQLQ